jgi:hypothetical protein
MVGNHNPMAQSFIPSMSPLTKIDLWIYARGVNDTLSISIRKELNGEDLTLISKKIFLDQVHDWVTFDFDDIDVNVGSIYYIVAEATRNTKTHNEYGWVFGENNPYKNGDMFYGSKWTLDMNGSDMCFRTYSRSQDEPPEKQTTPFGQINGKPGIIYNYSTSSIDPDGDKLYYFWDWGDKTTGSWFGPYNSGEIVEQGHSWAKKGTYDIKVKVKDKWGMESNWATLTVTMPYSYNKPIPQFLERLSQRFPNAFPLLRQLMGY